MTVQNQTVKNVYAGNGSTTVFPYTFALHEDDGEYVGVYVTNADTGISEPVTNFTIDTNAHTVTYPTLGDPLETGRKITIRRELPNEQQLNLENLGTFYAEDVEDEMDREVMMIQQLQEQMSRAVKVDMASEMMPAELIESIKESENNAKQSAEDAETSEDHARIWAEGTDAQVTDLGGTHSAKVWAQTEQKVYYTDNVASMRADSFCTPGMLVMTRGYYFPNDGGYGTYNIRAAQVSDVDDGGSIIILDNGYVAELITDGAVTVRQYGAKGDGVQDDSDYIQAAINSGHQVFIPNGTYNVSKALQITARNTSIIGESRNAILNSVGSVAYDNVLFIKSTASSGITLSTFAIAGNYKVNFGIKNEDWLGDSSIVNIKIGQCNTNGMYLIAWNCEITRCWVYNTPTGIELPELDGTRATSITIKNCFVSDATYGYVIDMTYGSLLDCAADRNDVAYYIRNSKGVNMFGCGAEGCKKIVQAYSWWGGGLIGFYGLNNGFAEATASDYLFDFDSPVDLSFGGYNGSVLGSPSMIRISNNRNGHENITVLDGSVVESQVSYVPNYRYTKPILFLRQSLMEHGIFRIKTVDGTTNSSGAIDLDEYAPGYTVLSVYDMGSGTDYIVIPYRSDTGQNHIWAMVFNTNMQKITNTTVSLKVVYSSYGSL